MPDFILFMHNDLGNTKRQGESLAWSQYIEKLQAKGVFQGGSSIGSGVCKNVSGSKTNITSHLVGYIRIQANSMRHVEELLVGNPVFEAGGTVEIRELPTE